MKKRLKCPECGSYNVTRHISGEATMHGKEIWSKVGCEWSGDYKPVPSIIHRRGSLRHIRTLSLFCEDCHGATGEDRESEWWQLYKESDDA